MPLPTKKRTVKMDNHDLNPDDGDLILLAETENYAVMVADDVDGETVYNIQLGSLPCICSKRSGKN
jgi:hypothetical protein